MDLSIKDLIASNDRSGSGLRAPTPNAATASVDAFNALLGQFSRATPAERPESKAAAPEPRDGDRPARADRSEDARRADRRNDSPAAARRDRAADDTHRARDAGDAARISERTPAGARNPAAADTGHRAAERPLSEAVPVPAGHEGGPGTEHGPGLALLHSDAMVSSGPAAHTAGTARMGPATGAVATAASGSRPITEDGGPRARTMMTAGRTETGLPVPLSRVNGNPSVRPTAGAGTAGATAGSPHPAVADPGADADSLSRASLAPALTAKVTETPSRMTGAARTPLAFGLHALQDVATQPTPQTGPLSMSQTGPGAGASVTMTVAGQTPAGAGLPQPGAVQAAPLPAAAMTQASAAQTPPPATAGQPAASVSMPTAHPVSGHVGTNPATLSNPGMQTAPAKAPPAARPSVPVPLDQVAVHIARAATAGSDHIQIKLKPASLGHVEVKLDLNHDGRVSAVVTVDRPDTLDMLQRDARALERALQDAGLKTNSDSLQFNLRGDGQARQETAGSATGAPDPHVRSSTAGAEDAPETPLGEYVNARAASGGVDITV